MGRVERGEGGVEGRVEGGRARLGRGQKQGQGRVGQV